MTEKFLFVLSLASFMAQCVIGQNPVSIESLISQQHLAGAVWTLVDGDSITTHSAGVRNASTGEKIDTHDKVHVGSITKTVIALGVLKLATENKLMLDEPISKYLPSLPLKNDWENTNPITIRHLLDHTSGLSDLRLWHFFSSSATPATPLEEFYTRSPDVLTIHERPGTMFSYSNMGYTLLGMIIERVINGSYEQYLDENLLKPIGMINSTFEFTSQEGRYETNELAMGHFDNGTPAPALPIYLRPAGQFTTTAHDMGMLIRFILDKGKAGTEQLIDSRYLASLGKPDYTIAFTKGLENGYAYGASLRDRHNVVGIAHSGNIIGYKAMLYIFPEQGKGFFISHNMDSETADYESFNRLLIETLQIQKTSITNLRGASTNEFSGWDGYYVPHITKVEPLKLFDIMSSYIQISFTERGAMISPFQKKQSELIHIGNGLFQGKDKVNPSHLLYEAEQDKFITTGLGTFRKISGWRIVGTTTSVILGLIGLLIVFISTAYQISKHRSRFFRKPLIWVSAGVVILIIAVVLMASKSVIYIGDRNIGSLVLYTGSLLLPLLSLVSIVAYVRTETNAPGTFGFWATAFVLQLTILLFAYGLIPFESWR